MEGQDPYVVLGVSRNATTPEIRLAYRKQRQRWHPDKNHNSAESHRRFLLIQWAYEHLHSPESRQRYEEEQRSPQQAPEPEPPQPPDPGQRSYTVRERQAIPTTPPVEMVVPLSLTAWLEWWNEGSMRWKGWVVKPCLKCEGRLPHCDACHQGRIEVARVFTLKDVPEASRAWVLPPRQICVSNMGDQWSIGHWRGDVWVSVELPALWGWTWDEERQAFVQSWQERTLKKWPWRRPDNVRLPNGEEIPLDIEQAPPSEGGTWDIDWGGPPLVWLP